MGTSEPVMQNAFPEFLFLHAEKHQGLCLFGHCVDPFLSVFHMIFQKASEPHPLLRSHSGYILHLCNIEPVSISSDLSDPCAAPCKSPEVPIFQADLVFCKTITFCRLRKRIPESVRRPASCLHAVFSPEHYARTCTRILVHAECVIIKTARDLIQFIF